MLMKLPDQTDLRINTSFLKSVCVKGGGGVYFVMLVSSQCQVRQHSIQFHNELEHFKLYKKVS